VKINVAAFIFMAIVGLSISVYVSAGSYLGGLIKVETGEKDQRESQEKPNTKRPDNNVYREGRAAFKIPVDVDSAYVKIKREFHFYTRQERIRATPGIGDQGSWLDNTDEFRYEALPGVRYHMKERTSHTYRGQDRKHNIEVFIEKDGSGSNVVFKFWVKDPAITDLDDYGRSIQARAEKSIGK